MDTSAKSQTETRDTKPPKHQATEETVHGPERLAQTAVEPAVALHRALGAPPPVVNPSDLLALQRTAGNKAVQRVMAARSQNRRPLTPDSLQPIQAKLTLNQPADLHEREADRIAEQVMTMPDPAGPCVSSGEVASAPKIQPLAVHRTSEASGPEAGGDFEGRLTNVRGHGSPLPAEIRAHMEPRFGADLSGVRVHTDAEADTLNCALQARAFTTGQDIFFRKAEYSPHSAGGGKLLAHELTHVIQQTGAGRLQRNGRHELVQVESRLPYSSISLKKLPMKLDFVRMKRKTTHIAKMLLSKVGLAKEPEDAYGHWWTEIGDSKTSLWEAPERSSFHPVESYGWWPKPRVSITKTLRGVEGALNRGEGDKDPHQGDSADVEFHPVAEVDENEDYETLRQRVVSKIREEAHGYKGKWYWRLGWGRNCQTFQERLKRKAGLHHQKCEFTARRPENVPKLAEAGFLKRFSAYPGIGSQMLELMDYRVFKGITLDDLEKLTPRTRNQMLQYLDVTPSEMDRCLSAYYGQPVTLFQQITS